MNLALRLGLFSILERNREATPKNMCATKDGPNFAFLEQNLRSRKLRIKSQQLSSCYGAECSTASVYKMTHEEPFELTNWAVKHTPMRTNFELLAALEASMM